MNGAGDSGGDSTAADDPTRRRRLGIALSLVSVAGVTVFLFWPLFAGLAGGTVHWFEWDVPEQYWPDLVYLCESVHAGELPYWNPYDRGGYPYYADPQAGLYHPLNWAICGVAGPSPGLGWASARVVLGFLLAGLFGVLWLRRIGASWSGAIAGAALIEAAPFMRHNWELNLTLALAWLPLVLWAGDRLAIERRIPDGVVFAIALALCGWVGSPPALWLTISLAIPYVAFRFGEAWRREGRAVARGLPAVIVGAVLSVGLLGAVLVPGAQLAEHSVQAGRSFASIADGALEGEDLFALVWPRSGNHLYVGWLALALVPFALRHERRRLAWFFVAASALAVLMATGGPVFRAAFELVPGVRLFRLPHRYEAWLGPAAGAIVALGLSDAARRTLAGPAATRLRVAAAVAAILGVVALVVTEHVGTQPVGTGATPGLLLLAVAVILVARTTPRPFDGGSPMWGVVLAGLMIVDVTQAMPPERHMRADAPPGSAAVASEMLAHAPHTRDRYRLMDEFGIAARSGTRLRRRDLRGYQDPLLLRSYERVIGSLREHPALAPQLNVRYALQGPHFIHGWDRHYLPPPDTLRAALRTRVRYEDDAERSVTELLDAMPLAYFVPAAQIEVAPDRSSALDRVRALAPSAIAVLESPSAIDAGSAGAQPGLRPRSAGRDVSLSSDTVRFTIDAPSAGVVVVNEAFYPGWTARVDGAPAPIVRANAFVRAVPVEPGEHTVQMRFEPADGARWRQILLGSVLAALLMLIGAPLFDRLRRSR